MLWLPSMLLVLFRNHSSVPPRIKLETHSLTTLECMTWHVLHFGFQFEFEYWSGDTLALWIVTTVVSDMDYLELMQYRMRWQKTYTWTIVTKLPSHESQLKQKWFKRGIKCLGTDSSVNQMIMIQHGRESWSTLHLCENTAPIFYWLITGLICISQLMFLLLPAILYCSVLLFRCYTRASKRMRLSPCSPVLKPSWQSDPCCLFSICYYQCPNPCKHFG